MHESLQMCTFLKRKFHEKYSGDVHILPIFEKSRKARSLPFFFRNRLQKKKKKKKKEMKFYKFFSNCFIDLKHPFGCCVFLFLRIFADF